MSQGAEIIKPVRLLVGFIAGSLVVASLFDAGFFVTILFGLGGAAIAGRFWN